MHAARVMGAQTSRLVGLDSLEPTVEMPQARPPRAAARDAAGRHGEGEASGGGGGRPRHAELMPAAASIGPALASAYDELIEEVAARHRVAPHLVRAVIKVESNFQPQARSPKGAMGLMQVMPTTGKRFGAADLRDPRENVNAGTRYLRWLLDRFDDDLALTLAAYNAGEGAVERHGRRIPPYAETQGYVTKVLGHLGMASSGRAAEPATVTNAAGAMAAPAPTKRAAERQLASGPPAASREAVRALHTVSGWIGAMLTSGSRRPAADGVGEADGQRPLPVADRDTDGFERPDGGRGAAWPGERERSDGRLGSGGSARPV
ncbi:lytic transglycosylase domain-containing protein [Cupriavidus sp. AU9028]|nr:lytic transglycosylase domain-containing protein [Cupriavidus sp. AU9028]